MMNDQEPKRLVAEAGRMLLHEGLAARTWGNVSCRTGVDSMVITPSGLGYESMMPDDIVEMDMSTGEWKGALKPSSEKAVHIAAYRAFPDAGFVIHTHQTYASAIGLAGFFSLSLSAEEKEALDGLALSGYGLPGTKKLCRNITGAFSSGAHAVLLAHHGAVIVGKGREEAFARARLLETVCRRACKGQPTETPVFDESLAHRLTEHAKIKFGYAAYTAAPPVLACAATGRAIPAQLDDTAQMLGPLLSVVNPEEHSALNELAKKDAVLIPGVGAICRASTEDDCRAMCLLLEKACICRLHTEALGVSGRLSGFDTRLMRFVYLKKYSKKKDGISHGEKTA